MHKRPIPTKEQFDSLMTWLGSNGEDPGLKYVHIRQSLEKVFSWNGCNDPEDLADDAIDRVVRRVPELMITFSGDPAHFFYGVAKKMLQECRRQKPLSSESE